MKQGTVVRMSSPQGDEDKRVASMKGDRCAVIMEITPTHQWARIHFYGDAKEATYLVHPESLEVIR